MTWLILPGMDGTGELVAPFVALRRKNDVCVVVRYPRTKLLTREELRKFMEDFLPRFEDYVLVAESFSGQFAIEIAARNPPRLRGLVLVATFATCPVNVLARITLSTVGEALMRIGPPRWFIRRFLTGNDAPGEDVKVVRDAIASVNGGVLASRLRMVLRCDVEGLLRHIKTPTLVIAAANDRLIPRKTTEQLKEVPSAEFVSVDSAHLAMFSRPADVWGKIQSHGFD